MANSNWTNKWVLILMAGIVIQVIAYSFIAVFKVSDFAIHPFFFDVMLIAFASVVVQIGGFVVIMSKTRNLDPAIYGQGRPFQHKLREEDEDLATRRPTFAD